MCTDESVECDFSVEDITFEDLHNIPSFDRVEYLDLLDIRSWECSRRAWDKAEDQRCVWHAEVKNKPDKELYETINQGDIHGAKLSEETTFQGAMFIGKDMGLIKSDFFKVQFSEETDLSGADLRHANLSETKLFAADLSQATFSNTDLSDANLNEANLTGAEGSANLTHADLGYTTLTDTSLSGEFTSTNLADSTMIRTSLENAKLYNADLTDAEMTDVNFSGADLRRVAIDHNNFDEIQIDGATNFGGKSLFESRADLEAFDASSFRGVGRARTSGDRLKSAERQYRATQRKLRTNNYQELLEMDIREKHARRKRALAERDYFSWSKLAFYRWPLGYGERLLNVISTSLLLIIGFGLVYPFAGGVEMAEEKLEVYSFGEILTLPGSVPGWVETLWANLYFSLISFSTLGYGDIQPANSLVQGLAGVQSIIGALLIAYLVFILGRRSTR
jgi:uncharacterized protein YjbI with pentapeptide repeats